MSEQNSDLHGVPLTYVAILVEHLGTRGVNTRELLKTYGITPEQLQNPVGKISPTSMNEISRLAENAITDPEFWFAYGEKLTIATHGALGHALMACQNLWEVLNFFFRYYHIQMPMLDIERIENESEVGLRMLEEEETDVRDFGSETIFSAFYTNLKILLNEDNFPISFSFKRSEPEELACYQEHLGDKVFFGQEHTELKVPKSYLDHPIIFSNPVMRRYYAEQCEKQLDELLTTKDLKTNVKEVISATPGFFPHIEQVANQLNMSERTLRRKLKEENSSFREILDDNKKSKAIEYLVKTNLSIENIANLLGYSDNANFRRAFQKWTNMSPAAYRKNL